MMVAIVTAADRSHFTQELDQMHRDRKRVFVDWLQWKVDVVDGVYEIDRFDNEDAVYLIEAQQGRHLASIRLLPTTKPHLMSEVFSGLCASGVPRGPDIWEFTRFCISPDVSKPEARRLLELMRTATVEYAQLYGITRYTCVTHLAFLSQLLALGWDTEPLGMPQEVDGMAMGAIQFNITPKSLARSREHYGYLESVLQLGAHATCPANIHMREVGHA
jgi:acyl-homoserine lactone synthase